MLLLHYQEDMKADTDLLSYHKRDKLETSIIILPSKNRQHNQNIVNLKPAICMDSRTWWAIQTEHKNHSNKSQASFWQNSSWFQESSTGTS